MNPNITLMRELKHLEENEEEEESRFITSFERLGIEKGLKLGKQEGWQQGLLDGERRILMRQFLRKFGVMQREFEYKIEQGKPEELILWSEKILHSSTLEEVFDIEPYIYEDEKENKKQKKSKGK